MWILEVQLCCCWWWWWWWRRSQEEDPHRLTACQTLISVKVRTEREEEGVRRIKQRTCWIHIDLGHSKPYSPSRYRARGGRTSRNKAADVLNPHRFRAYKILISIYVYTERRKDLE
jgi:hypothetical protein